MEEYCEDLEDKPDTHDHDQGEVYILWWYQIMMMTTNLTLIASSVRLSSRPDPQGPSLKITLKSLKITLKVTDQPCFCLKCWRDTEDVRGSGKPLFEMCWFYMGIVQIALDPTPPVKRANMGKKCAQTILASLYTPPYGQCPYGNNTFHKGGSLSITAMTMTTVTTSTCCWIDRGNSWIRNKRFSPYCEYVTVSTSNPGHL